MLVLSEGELIGSLPAQQIVAAVEEALRAQETGHVVPTRRLHLQWHGNTLLQMLAMPRVGWGVTSGLMIVNDIQTGFALAIMNAAELTAQRTAAVGALGVKYSTPPETVSAGNIGCGVRDARQANIACVVRPIKDVFVSSRPLGFLEQFVATVSRHAPGARVIPWQAARELLERTDLVVTATTFAAPVLPDEPQLLAAKHFISVGSYRLTIHELPACVYRLSRLLAVESQRTCEEVGLLKETEEFSIAECVMGRRTVDAAWSTACKSVGAVIYDPFVEQALYHAAKLQGLGLEIVL